MTSRIMSSENLSTPEKCEACLAPKADRHCELCDVAICRKCDQFLSEEAFPFLDERPAELSFTHYCPSCHDREVAPRLQEYEETLERARGIYFISSAYRGYVPVIRKALAEVKVENCIDRDETILRLAFKAAQQGFNAVIQAEVGSEKVRNHGFQKSRWSGRGMPALVDAGRIERNEQRFF